MKIIAILFFIARSSLASAIRNTSSSYIGALCLYRGRYYMPKEFLSLVSVDCFQYLFSGSNDFLKEERKKHGRSLFPDIQISGDVSLACSHLNGEQCQHWKQCCGEAEKCCKSQLQSDSSLGDDNSLSCPKTWDGYLCWNETAAGMSVDRDCPAYVTYEIIVQVPQKVWKFCTINGSWWRHPDNDIEWSNYSSCIQQDFKTLKLLGDLRIICDGLSVVFLTPAIILFLAYKELRIQKRIGIHVNFFCSLLLENILEITVTYMISYKKLYWSNEQLPTADKVQCLALYFMLTYSELASFFWLLCEGIYLHRLMAKSFKPTRKLFFYVVFGWSTPLIILTIYAIIRITLNYHPSNIGTGELKFGSAGNRYCWIGSAGNIEWILHASKLGCLLVNLVILCCILRQIIRLQPHPNEPSTFRRSIKATLVLAPLFGLQMFFFMFNPKYIYGYYIKTYLGLAVDDCKGIIIAVVFCYIKAEVRSLIRSSFCKIGKSGSRRVSLRKGSNSSCPTTQSQVLETTKFINCSRSNGVSLSLTV